MKTQAKTNHEALGNSESKRRILRANDAKVIDLEDAWEMSSKDALKVNYLTRVNKTSM